MKPSRPIWIRTQKGGVIPLAAVDPGLVAAGKTAGLAALGAVVGQKTKQWMKKKNKRKTPWNTSEKKQPCEEVV